ncbi:MAG: XdhC family protein [Deltaproteobacteria bacterium]|nr:XdhC family protein [Deltaproteobacteria bacterium]
MKDIYLKIKDLIKKGRFSVLATIIQQAGPSPRGLGTKFLVLDDGSFIGTIGGGLLEARTLEGARKVFDTRLPLRLSFSLKGSDAAQTDMLCGGDVEVFLEPMAPDNPGLSSLCREILSVTKRGGPGLVVTRLDPESWQHAQVPKILLEQEKQWFCSLSRGNAFEDALFRNSEHILASRLPAILTFEEGGGKVEVFVEAFISDPALFIFGGGHVSREIVPLASLVGFKVAVIDDRKEFAKTEQFPHAREVHQYPFEGVMDRLAVDASSYLVIVTRGHIHDKMVLEQSLRTKAGYIGMIGSRRKRNMIYENLLEQGFTQNDLARVHSPIGLNIGAETPEEIAVSIVAELIQVRAGKEK